MYRFLLCCLVAALPLFSLSAAEVGKSNPVVATLDFEAFLKNASLHTNRYAQLQEELNQYIKRFDEMANRNKKIETRIGMTEKNDPGYDVLVQDLETGKLRLDLAQKQAKQRLERKKQEMLQASINDSVDMLDDFCNEQGIDIVIQTGGPEPEREVPIANMAVLYANPTLDITEAFLAYANAKVPAAGTEKEPADSAPVLESLNEDQQ